MRRRGKAYRNKGLESSQCFLSGFHFILRAVSIKGRVSNANMMVAFSACQTWKVSEKAKRQTRGGSARHQGERYCQAMLGFPRSVGRNAGLRIIAPTYCMDWEGPGCQTRLSSSSLGNWVDSKSSKERTERHRVGSGQAGSGVCRKRLHLLSLMHLKHLCEQSQSPLCKYLSQIDVKK